MRIVIFLIIFFDKRHKKIEVTFNYALSVLTHSARHHSHMNESTKVVCQRVDIVESD